MRILYCNKYNFAFSGTEVYLFELMDLMRSHGHEVALFSMADARGPASEYDEYLVDPVDFKKPRTNLLNGAMRATRALYSRESRRKLRTLVKAFRPDVAHVRNIYHHLSPSILWELKALGVPVIYHLNDFKLLCPSYNMVSHGWACERCRGGRFWHVATEGCYQGRPGSGVVLAAEAYLHKWLRTYETCVTRFVAPSRFVKEKLDENGWDAGKIDVLPHFQRVSGEEPREPAPNAPILYFGRLSSEKGVSDLLRAMQLLPGIHLQIAGDGPLREHLQTMAGELLLSNVQFLGHLDRGELQHRIAAARFTVLPSRAYETLGKSILESYAFGKTVVASDLGSRRELVREGQTGMLFPAGDVKQLAAAIAFLAERPALAAKLGAAGRRLLLEEHSPERHYQAMYRLYVGVASSGDRPAGSKAAPAAARKLRVAFIGGRGVASRYSGVETYYEEVGQRLAAMGHEVTAYCRNYFTPRTSTYNDMRLVRLPTIHSKHLETFAHTLLSTIHALFCDYDIVHYHCLGPALFSIFPRCFGKRVAVTVQGLDWRRSKWGVLASTVLRLGERAAIRFPDSTMVVSRTLQEYFRLQYGISPFYVPNATRLRCRCEPVRLKEWELESGGYVLFLGRFSPEKNCHLLVNAFEKIDAPVKLVLAGGSSHSDVYARRLQARQSERIHVMDWVSGKDMDELLTHALLLVLPSDIEGLSLALLDAMGAGVCVLTSDIPENRELVDGVGFTFRRNDEGDLVRMLRFLISEPEVRDGAARKARARVQERFLWDHVAKEIESVYLEMMGRDGRHGVLLDDRPRAA